MFNLYLYPLEVSKFEKLRNLFRFITSKAVKQTENYTNEILLTFALNCLQYTFYSRIKYLTFTKFHRSIVANANIPRLRQ